MRNPLRGLTALSILFYEGETVHYVADQMFIGESSTAQLLYSLKRDCLCNGHKSIDSETKDETNLAGELVYKNQCSLPSGRPCLTNITSTLMAAAGVR